ncbi:hypothetical protein H8B15_13245 [Hymenobacter sp. BT507]|uniref:SRPBCC family protein n=1 Tax=Hymenobacter citatus TaxID=2763506 RepID=A0ABR7MMV0_9BACT|nr:hypothetical protein [Hymenobacter citatus]MBC6611893.1 hypothetical protein [Hymenobacter citatus]
MILPLFIFTATIGAKLYDMWAAKRPPRDRSFTVAVFIIAPFLAGTFETWYAAPTDFRRVENTILIQAPASVVWQHITRVPAISTAELAPSLVDKLGFPRPVKATLTYEGVGGVRHATFERGVEFIETVDVWEPQRRLSFSIKPNTATIPPTTFDEHVTIGGRFFDVLHGTYELHAVSPTQTRLVLYSQQRLSTRLNFYAGLWTDYIMGDIQERILTVIRKRCETPAI